MESSWIILGTSTLVMLPAAYVLLHFYILKDLKVSSNQIKSRGVSLLFSFTFTCSGLLLELFLLELSPYQVNSAEWTLTLSVFSFLMLVGIPVSAVFMLFKGWRYRTFLTLVGFGCQVAMIRFSWQLMQEVLLGCDSACQDLTCPGLCVYGSLVEQVRLLGVSAMMLSAVLSGFGAVNCTYIYFNFFNLQTSQGDLDELQHQTSVNLRQLNSLRAIKAGQQASTPTWWTWLAGQGDSDQDYLDAELKALEAIHSQYIENISEIQSHRERELLSHSLRGKVYSVLAWFLAVYAVYKLVFASVNALFRRKYSIDPISRCLVILGWFIDIDPTFKEFVSSQVSFLFIGVLIFANIRSFTQILAWFARSFGRHLSSGISTETFLVVASSAMGSYFLASVLLMRSNMPIESRQGISSALDGLDFFTFHHIFDATFAVASLTSAIVLYVRYIFSVKCKTI